jgi:hypothetical protein
MLEEINNRDTATHEPASAIRVPARYIRDFSFFTACSSSKNSHSDRFASAANVVCRDAEVFGAKIIVLLIIFYN